MYKLLVGILYINRVTILYYAESMLGEAINVFILNCGVNNE